MNKAFVREPDSTVERCPQCGSPGEPVGPVTLDAMLRPECRAQLGAEANFCPSATCSIAYFDQFERSATVDALVHRVYPKDPEAPICPCFGLTPEEVENEALAGEVTRVRAAIERAKSTDVRCPQTAPNGRSCVAEIQRYYMKHRSGG
ncbi:MAG: hypothetical protein AB7O26_07100 [Planctomycetaceae bacterium]